jgi:S1-C subfamily serine protease
MASVKRFWMITAVVALALGALGVASVGASDTTHDGAALAQDDGGAWLGVSINDTADGVTVIAIASGSPAEDAGLRMGDVILAVDGTEITSAAMLVETIQSYVPGDEVSLTVESRGEEREVTVTLGERPATSGVTIAPQVQGMMFFLGVEARMTDDGLLIESVEDNSPLADAGLQEGDLITAINGEPVDEVFPRLLMQTMRSNGPVMLTVQRDGEELEIEVDLSEVAGGVFGGPAVIEVPGTPPGQLGIRFITLTPDIAEERGLDVSEGALIEEVLDNSPAAEAGLEAGDVITAVDGDVVDEERTLPDRLYAYEEGDVVMLTVLRNGEELELEVTLGPRGPVSAPGMMDDGFWGPGMMGDNQYGPHMGWRSGRGGQNGPGYGPGMRFRFSMPDGSFDRQQFEDMFPHFFENHPFFFGPNGDFEFRFGPSDSTPNVPDTEPAPDVNSTAA